MKYDFDIAVIGGGSGGLVAASLAKSMQARVLLIEGGKMGGDCLNYGCVPSKTFLKSAHLFKEMKKASDYGIIINDATASIPQVMSRVNQVIESIAPHDSVERFESMGVEVIKGIASIVDEHSVLVNDKVYSSKRIIIATGSAPVVPGIPGLKDVNYYNNETIFSLSYTPKKMIVLGAGVIGLELGQGFACMDIDVSIVDHSSMLFAKEDSDVGEVMLKEFINDGMHFHLGTSITRVYKKDENIIVVIKKDNQVTELECDTLFVALGRKPNVDSLQLKTVGINQTERGYIEVNQYLQTSLPSIYAIGDVVGQYQFTHIASYHASVAVKNALLINKFKTSYYNVAWTTYTSPEVSHVGMLEVEARKQNKKISVYKLPISQNDRSKAQDDMVGFIKVILDQNSIVIGATIVSNIAGELLPLLSYMVTHKKKVNTLMNVIFQYPIQGEILKTVGLEVFKDNVKKWQVSLLKNIVQR